MDDKKIRECTCDGCMGRPPYRVKPREFSIDDVFDYARFLLTMKEATFEPSEVHLIAKTLLTFSGLTKEEQHDRSIRRPKIDVYSNDVDEEAHRIYLDQAEMDKWLAEEEKNGNR